ncbi:unnamed protein product [Urochloa decumbens]|uniref:J domain-containing protein n=1 Tax=Urochloa decumbens TaxID=240449 RepID=A0ABC9GN73_9POAL
MSYNKTTERRPDDLIEMPTCTVKPSMDFVIDSRNLSYGPATNHVSRNDNGTMANHDNGKNPSSVSANSRSPESDFVVDQKQPSPSWTPISGSVSANESHKNLDSHSTHSTITPDYAFLRVSDTDAQTQSNKVQPLLRQQPKLPNKKESAAAMKEAMDFAEARLKAAKELLERKGDSFKLRKKPSHHRSTRSTEIRAPVSVEVDTSEQKLSVKKPLEEKNPDDSLSDKNKNLNAVRSDHFDNNGKRVLPLEKPQQMMQRSTESCKTSSKLEKLGKWKSGNDFFELTGDDQKCKTNETTRDDDKCERMNPITGVLSDYSETELSAADSDLARYEKLWEVNDGMNLGVKHVNLREEGKTTPVDKDRVSVILEASAEYMAHQKTDNSVSEGHITPELAKESHDTDECPEFPSTSDASTKLDVIKDMPGSLLEPCTSGSASDFRDPGNSIPMVNPVAGTSQDTDGNAGMQSTSVSNEKLQEPSDVSNVAMSQGSNIKSLILEELKETNVCDTFSRPRLGKIEPEAETYGREKFSFIDGSLLHNKRDKINEVLFEEVEKVEIEEKVVPGTHPEEIVVDLDAECPVDDNNIILQNDNLADQEESNMLNVFEVASNLIKRELDQEMHGSLSPGEADNVGEGMDGLVSDVNAIEADETPLENSGRTGSEEGSAPCNQEDQKSPESTNRGQSDAEAECDTTCDEVGSGSFSGDDVVIKAASDSASRTTIDSKDELASSSEMYTRMQHSMQKDETATFHTFCSVSGLGKTEEISNRERESPTKWSTCEEKSRASKMGERDTAARISKAEHRPSPLEATPGLTESAEGPSPVSAERVQRARERENITREDSAIGKENGSSRKTQEAKEAERRLQKERELAEENERRKLEEEERERERKKDRLAVERATREAHERAFAEAREKAEKMALERITAARQRASAEAREKEERASVEAAAERATREARIKAERAAVERATAEARERAIEKAKAEKALAEARERRERYRSSFKEGFKSNQDIRQESQFHRATSSNFTRNPDSGNRAVVEVESALRHKARLERHQRTTERVTKALAEKNMRDVLAQREQAEKHRLSEFLDPEIKRWSNGKEGNLRALLSTLQYILGADSGWQPVPLTDLITAVAVKKAYRKATLCVHPDKLQQRGATIRQKYICEKVFDLLKDAWNKFTSEER